MSDLITARDRAIAAGWECPVKTRLTMHPHGHMVEVQSPEDRPEYLLMAAVRWGATRKRAWTIGSAWARMPGLDCHHEQPHSNTPESIATAALTAIAECLEQAPAKDGA